MTRPIDLRSDTVSQPTREMREAMAQAPVGEDLYGEDLTVNTLESQAAVLLGKAAALFLPTGTMGNLIALKAHAQAGDEVILEERSHIYNSEMAGLAGVAGLLARPLRGDASGMLRWDDVRAHIRPPHRSQTRLICLENTHNFAGGAILDQAAVVDFCGEAHDFDLPVHLDGARLGNAAAATDRSLTELAAPVDSVMFDFSKGLGAPAGAVLAGTDKFVARARRIRKMLGGEIHQPGILAAACLHGIKRHLARLGEDHETARRLAQGIAALPGISVNTDVPTNIVIARLRPGLNSAALAATMRKHGVLASVMDDGSLRFVTHLDVSHADVEAAVEAISKSVCAVSPLAPGWPNSTTPPDR